MQHLYFDTSDLNAPYDQYRSARPLQGIGAVNHLYMDYSNLNAQYDRSRPAIHGLGGGSLGGSALGNKMPSGIGAAMESSPPAAVAMQQSMNVELQKLGCSTIGADGVIGKKTCGALLYLGEKSDTFTSEMERALEQCTEFSYSCSGGSAPPLPTLPKSETSLPRSRGGGIGLSSNTMMIGGAVLFGVLMIGGAYYYKQKGGF
jgi:hypothetical protein